MVATTRDTQIRPGYKQTEVGVIPEEWEVKKLGDVVEVILGGGTPDRSKSEYWRGNIPWATVKDFATFDPYSTQESITEVGLQNSSSNLIKKGTIIISTRMALGKAVIYEVDVCINQDLKAIYLKKDICTLFMFYWFEQNAKNMENLGGGSTVKGISLSDLKNVPFLKPATTEEQRAIAAVLSDVDALLSALDRLIAKKRAIKQATMQQLLTGRMRLPGFSGQWEVRKLGEIVEVILGGGTPDRSKSEYWGGSIPWTTVKDLATFDPYSTQESITEVGLQNSSSNLIKKGTIIISTRMALGKAVIYEVDVCINQDLKAIFLKKDICTLFVFYWFEQNAKNMENLGGGSTVKGISLSDLKNVPFLKPATTEEQRAIAAVLSDMDAEIVALERKRDKLRALKQGMMQELLTGRIRLL